MIRLFTKTRRRKTRDGFSPSPLIRELDAAGYVRVTDAVTADQPSEITQAQFQGLVSGAGSLGPLADTTALNSTYPAASNAGKSALVGASAPYATYDCNGSAWSPRTGGGSANFVDAEVPAGTKNGVNQTFTLANTPSPAVSLRLYFNGLILAGAGVDYTLTGGSLVLTTLAPTASDGFLSFYRY